jgi:hypothetical protein
MIRPLSLGRPWGGQGGGLRSVTSLWRPPP